MKRKAGTAQAPLDNDELPDAALADSLGIREVSAMSEEVFSRDWLSPDDEAAWKDL